MPREVVDEGGGGEESCGGDVREGDGGESRGQGLGVRVGEEALADAVGDVRVGRVGEERAGVGRALQVESSGHAAA